MITWESHTWVRSHASTSRTSHGPNRGYRHSLDETTSGQLFCLCFQGKAKLLRLFLFFLSVDV